MVIDKSTREEWRKLAGQGMNSALGEYTPVDEFIALLDYIDELEAQLTKHAPDVVESAASSELVQAESESTSEADTTPATTQVM